MAMKTIEAFVSWNEGKFFVYTESEIGVSAMGDSMDEAKGCLEKLLSEYADLCFESGATVPKELTGDYSVEYHMETSALLQELPVSLKALASASGVNQRQLSAYKNGVKTPRKETKVKILRGIREIGDSLCRVTPW